MPEESDSILISIKNSLGLAEDYEAFDPTIIMHINSVLSVLHQVGASPEGGLKITDETTTWDEFLQGHANLEMVKTYVYLKVRNLFDPPDTSYRINAVNEAAKELEWRLNIEEDVFKPPIEIP